jgi:hypothetical protein
MPNGQKDMTSIYALLFNWWPVLAAFALGFSINMWTALK